MDRQWCAVHQEEQSWDVIFHVKRAENAVLTQHMVHWKLVHFHAYILLVFLKERG